MATKADRPRVLIEQWLPIAEIGAECMRERGASSALPPLYFLHVWWARRPLTVCRAAILASLLPSYPTDDDGIRPWPTKFCKRFPTFDDYKAWFLRFIGIHGDPLAGRRLIEWARKTGKKFTGNPYGYPRAFTMNPSEEQLDTFNQLLEWTWGKQKTRFCDPMSGGGSIPFEALRYGLTVHANELNPVASVILTATLDYPARFGLALVKDLESWGKIFSDRVCTRLAPYFPRQGDEDIFVYIWCRTVACPYTGKQVSLSPNWWLEKLTKTEHGRQVTYGTAMQPIYHGDASKATFRVIKVENKRPFDPNVGTVRGGKGVSPWALNQVITGEYIKAEAQAGRMGQQLCAIGYVTREGRRFRQVTGADLAGVNDAAKALSEVRETWEAQSVLPTEQRYIGPSDRLENYGELKFSDVFGTRQFFALGTIVDEFRRLGSEIQRTYSSDPKRAEAVIAYLAIAVDKVVDYNSRQAGWHSSRGVIEHTFRLHDFRFKWNHIEYDVTVPRLGMDWVIGQVTSAYRDIAKLAMDGSGEHRRGLYAGSRGKVADRLQISSGTAASIIGIPDGHLTLVCVDPPYYDNVIYSECSDFFYVWLKRTFGAFYPDGFLDELTNKDEEAVANWARFEEFGRGKKKQLARQDYERKMAAVFCELHRVLHGDGTLAVMFTHKEVDAWETLGSVLIEAGFAVATSWPVHTESEHSLHQAKKNAAASTILLTCRKRVKSAEPVWWDDLKKCVRDTARQKASEFEGQGIRGVDLYISTFGPVLSIISENWPVLTNVTDPKTGNPLPLKPGEALDLARQEVVNLRKQGLLLGRSVEFDPITDWYLMAWDAFKAQEFPADEARKLALALGLDLEQNVVKDKRLVTKQSANVVLNLPTDRRKKGMVDEDAASFPH